MLTQRLIGKEHPAENDHGIGRGTAYTFTMIDVFDLQAAQSQKPSFGSSH